MRCTDRFGLDRCELEAGHAGFHRHGEHSWGFEDTRIPEWRRRAEADFRARGFVASKALDPA